MSRAQYILVETFISIAINVALSIGFALLVFHGQSRVSVPGRHGIAVDMAPQTFMIVLMAFLVPALLTRRRLAAGALPWRDATAAKQYFNALFWALAAAAIATCVVFGLSYLLLPYLLPTGAAFRPFLLAKAVFGGALAAVVTPWAIRTAIGGS